MKPLVLLLMVLLPIGAMAQEVASSPKEGAPSATGSGLAGGILSTNFGGIFFGPSRYSSLAFLLGLRLGAPQMQRRETVQASKPGPEVQRPRTEGSMVGYIENAIVGSQIRIRFDAGFNNDTPDLAEFFYAKCGCYKLLATAIPAAYDPNASGPGPGVPKDLNFQQLYLNAEYAPNRRFSAFSEIPFRWIQPQSFLAVPPFPGFANQGGISDVRAGIKIAILASSDRYLTAQFKTYGPSGHASKGLGTNHWSIEPAVLYFQKLSSRAALEAQLGEWHPIGGSAGVPILTSKKFSGDVLFYGVGPSYELYRGERVRFAPVVELVGWRIMGGFQTQPGGPILGAAADTSGTNIVNIKVGARTAFGRHNSIYAGYGRALASADWYKDLVRIEYRYSF